MMQEKMKLPDMQVVMEPFNAPVAAQLFASLTVTEYRPFSDAAKLWLFELSCQV